MVCVQGIGRGCGRVLCKVGILFARIKVAIIYWQAIFEAKVLAVMLLQRFSFTIDPAEAEKIIYSQTLTMNICNNKDAAIKDRTHKLLLKATPRK